MLLRTALLGSGLLVLAVFVWPEQVPVRGRQGVPGKDAGALKADLWVDAERGRPGARGTQDQPCQSLSQAINLLPEPLTHPVTIRVAGGVYSATGGQDMPADRLELMRRMRPGVGVRIVGVPGADGLPPRLAWEGGTAMIHVCEGEWWVENVQIGTGTTRQRRGVMVTGPARVTLKDVTFRTRSQSDAAIYAERGGLVLLHGAIRINEHLHEKAPDESFAGIVATDHGVVRFEERDGASLDIGNGSLAASYYGVIRLGCRSARVTSWGEQSNTLAINNSGRIDLHNTTTTLCARRKANTPIGLEHDGHILAEGAHIIIQGVNENAIVLQKSSTLTCNDIELQGSFKTAISAMSGSMFVGAFLGDIPGVSASTSATINIEEMKKNGKIVGSVSARRGAVISLPDRTVLSK
jgi:hypothetical protein